MPSFLFYLVIIIFCLNTSGCGVKSSPFLTKKASLIEDE